MQPSIVVDLTQDSESEDDSRLSYNARTQLKRPAHRVPSVQGDTTLLLGGEQFYFKALVGPAANTGSQQDNAMRTSVIDHNTSSAVSTSAREDDLPASHAVSPSRPPINVGKRALDTCVRPPPKRIAAMVAFRPPLPEPEPYNLGVPLKDRIAPPSSLTHIVNLIQTVPRGASKPEPP
ncbi:hypothetical protein HWV62_22487 [Athelia sp. TMB]|nr:hypothetical protein HWV62_22487 [Athelia sp. TMB]